MSVLEKSQFCTKKYFSNFFREILKNMSKMRFYFIDAPSQIVIQKLISHEMMDVIANKIVYLCIFKDSFFSVGLVVYCIGMQVCRTMATASMLPTLVVGLLSVRMIRDACQTFPLDYRKEITRVVLRLWSEIVLLHPIQKCMMDVVLI